IWEVFSTLSLGAELYIVPDTVRQDAYLLGRYIEEYKINTALLPPVLLNMMSLGQLEKLKTLLVGGERCPEDIVEKWRKDRRLINAYGPTEYTVCASMHQYQEGDRTTNIGRPLKNTAT
uniref:AMP-binding protein n=1 Tax=Sinomicrobium oceani TaxID=1150368 RepID=UPI00227CF6EC